MPTAATTQSVAAVVRPRTERPWRMIAPAPRKPIPVTICAAIRLGSARTTLEPDARNEWNPYAETSVKSAEPSDTSRCVRNPASRSRISRSRPIAPPRTAASASRSTTSHEASVGTLCIERALLGLSDLSDPGLGEIEQLVEGAPPEGRLLGGRLHLDELAAPGHDDVHVHLGRRVLGVVEVEHRRARDDPDRRGRNGPGERAPQPEAVERPVGGDVGPRDRGAPRAAVGLEDVAVDPQRPLAELLEVRHGTKRPADQALDLDGAPALLAARGLALGPVAGRGGQERVLRGQPAPALAVEPARHAVLDRRRAEHLRQPLREEHRPVRLPEEVRLEHERTQLVGPAPVRPRHAAAARSSARLTCSTSSIGSWRKRAPIVRKARGSPVVRKRYEPSRPSSFSISFRPVVPATSRPVPP